MTSESQKTGAKSRGEVGHEYIADVASELADIARELGDKRLGLLLDLAATFAERPRIDRH